MSTYRNTLQTLLAKLEPITECGCLIWSGPLRRDGYANVNFDNKTRMVHRVVWELSIGPIPHGMTLDHLCRVRCCANITHLEPVSMAENIRRGVSPSALNARALTCKRGHAFVQENIYTPPGSNRRHCRACRLAWAKTRWVTLDQP